MNENSPTKSKREEAIRRRKAALRDNLKRRKNQVRELKSPDEKELRLRDRDIKPG